MNRKRSADSQGAATQNAAVESARSKNRPTPTGTTHSSITIFSQNGRRESEAISAVMNVWRPAARAAEVDARRGGFGGRGGVAQPKRRFVNPSSCSAGYSVSHATNLKISDDFMNAKTGSGGGSRRAAAAFTVTPW